LRDLKQRIALSVKINMADDSIKLNDLSDDRKNLVGTSGSSSTRIQIVPTQPKTLSHLPSRPAVELAFTNLTYRVKEGRSNSEYLPYYFAATRKGTRVLYSFM
jgi:hypothetical protein